MKISKSLTSENVEFLIAFLSDYAESYEKSFSDFSSSFDAYNQGIAKGYRDVISFIHLLTMPL